MLTISARCSPEALSTLDPYSICTPCGSFVSLPVCLGGLQKSSQGLTKLHVFASHLPRRPIPLPLHGDPLLRLSNPARRYKPQSTQSNALSWADLCAGQDSNLRRHKSLGLQPSAIDHSATDAYNLLFSTLRYNLFHLLTACRREQVNSATDACFTVGTY